MRSKKDIKTGGAGTGEFDPREERRYEPDHTGWMEDSEEAIMKKLDDPLSEQAQTSGLFGNPRQHGSDLSYRPHYDREED